MTDKVVNESDIEKAVSLFEEAGLDSATALLASARLFTEHLNRFRKEAPAIRARVGEEEIKRFATEQLNDLIYEIQDSVPVAVRLFNSLMRDPTDDKGGPPE